MCFAVCAVCVGCITRLRLRSFLRRAATAGWCSRCHSETPRWKVCQGHTSHWRCCESSPARWAQDWASPQHGGTPCQRNTAHLRHSGAPCDGGGGGGGGLRFLMGCQQVLWRARSPSPLESELGMMADLGSTHNSLPGHSIHQDNLHSHECGISAWTELAHKEKVNNGNRIWTCKVLVKSFRQPLFIILMTSTFIFQCL